MCVVLSSGLRRNSYTHAGRARFCKPFDRDQIATQVEGYKGQKKRLHFIVLLNGVIHHAPIISYRIDGIPYQLVAVQVVADTLGED